MPWSLNYKYFTWEILSQSSLFYNEPATLEGCNQFKSMDAFYLRYHIVFD